MQHKLMIIDVSAVCYGLMHSLGVNDLSHNGMNTGIIFGFMTRLRYFHHTIKPTITIFVCDSTTSLRLAIYPQYKQKRTQRKKDDRILREMLQKTKPQVRKLEDKILPWLGFNNVFKTEGLEGDDIMHRIAGGYKSAQAILITRDKDMYQTLSPTCSMFDPQLKKFYTYIDLKTDWDCTPEEWGKARCISGCTTDEVSGIQGVAEKTAIKYLHGKLGVNTKTYQNITKGTDIINRNRALVVLPFAGTPKFILKKNTFNKQRLLKMAKHFGFASIEQTWDEWNLN